MDIFNGFEVPIWARNFVRKDEKLPILSSQYGAGALREWVPLKQGLKLFVTLCHDL